MARVLLFFPICVALMGCGGTTDVVSLDAPPTIGVVATTGGSSTGGGSTGGTSTAGGGGTGSVSLACALTGCEIAKLLVTTVMPSGSANYSGRVSYATENASGVIKTTNADLNLTASFNAATISLQISNFNDGLQYSGTALGGATITEAQFSGSYAGNLTHNGSVKPVSGTMTGQFRGSLAVALDGDIVATGEGGISGDAYGRFFANRQ